MRHYLILVFLLALFETVANGTPPFKVPEPFGAVVGKLIAQHAANPEKDIGILLRNLYWSLAPISNGTDVRNVAGLKTHIRTQLPETGNGLIRIALLEEDLQDNVLKKEFMLYLHCHEFKVHRSAIAVRFPDCKLSLSQISAERFGSKLPAMAAGSPAFIEALQGATRLEELTLSYCELFFINSPIQGHGFAVDATLSAKHQPDKKWLKVSAFTRFTAATIYEEDVEERHLNEIELLQAPHGLQGEVFMLNGSREW